MVDEKIKYSIDDSELRSALKSFEKLSDVTDEMLSKSGEFLPQKGVISQRVKVVTAELDKIKSRIENIDLNFVSNEDIALLNKAGIHTDNMMKKLERGKKLKIDDFKCMKDSVKMIDTIENEISSRAKLEDLILERVKETKEYKEEELKAIVAQRKEYEKMLREKGIVGTGIYGKAKARFMAQRDIEGPDTGPAMKSIGKLSGAFKMLGGVISKAFMPLLALLTLSEFLEFDKEVKDTRKELTGLAAESGMLYKNINKLSFAGPRGEIETIRLSLDNLLGSLRLTGEEAQSAMDTMIKSGFTMEEALGDVIKQNDTLGQRISKTGSLIGGALALVAREGEYALDGIKEIHKFSVLTGQSMDEAAQMAGDWKLQLGVAITDVGNLFTGMTKDAYEAGYQTSKFFDKVMQMSTEMIIYGNKIEQVSGAFSDLMEAMDLPKEVAAELASQLLTNVKRMSDETKVFIAKTGDAEQKLIEQINDRRKQIEEVNLEMVKAQQTGDEAEVRALKNRRENLQNEVKLYEQIQKIQDPLGRSLRTLEVLDPGKQLETQIRSLVSGIGENFDKLMETPDKFAQIFRERAFDLRKFGETFGFDTEQMLALEKTIQTFAKNTKILDNFADNYARQVGMTNEQFIDAIKAGDELLEKRLQVEFDVSVERIKELKDLPTTFDDIGKRDTEAVKSELEKQTDRQIGVIKTANTAAQSGVGMIAGILKNKIYKVIVGFFPLILKALNMIPGIEVDFPDFKTAEKMMEENSTQLKSLEKRLAELNKVDAKGFGTASERMKFKKEFARTLEDIQDIGREERLLYEGNVAAVERSREARRKMRGEFTDEEKLSKELAASGAGMYASIYAASKRIPTKIKQGDVLEVEGSSPVPAKIKRGEVVEFEKPKDVFKDLNAWIESALREVNETDKSRAKIIREMSDISKQLIELKKFGVEQNIARGLGKGKILYKGTGAEATIDQINQAIIDEINENLGRPYEFGAKGRGAGGIDCSGFVEIIQDSVATDIVGKTNAILKDKSAAGQIIASKEIDFSQLRPGDIIGIDASMRKGFGIGKSGVDHILQVYASKLGEMMVAESKSGTGVVTSTLEDYMKKAQRKGWGTHFGRPEALAGLGRDSDITGGIAAADLGKSTSTRTYNDNRKIEIHVNQRDVDTIKNLIRQVTHEEQIAQGKA